MIATSPKQKGPTSAATLIRPCPKCNPGKDHDMNSHSNTIAAPDRQARATHEAVASAMRDLEDDIHSLSHMSHILADMLDHNLTEPGPNGRVSMPKKGGFLTVRLTYSQMDQLSFAWNNVANRASKLRDRFNAACDGEVAS